MKRSSLFIFIPVVFVCLSGFLQPVTAKTDFPDTLYSRAVPLYLLPDKLFVSALHDKIRHAADSILISAYVFNMGTGRGKNQAGETVKLLAEAVKRGVSVSVVLEQVKGSSSLNKINRKTADKLTQQGIQVYFDSPGKTGHAKLVVIDNRWVLIGSHNMTDAALKKNSEFSVMADSPEFAREVSTYIFALAGL